MMAKNLNINYIVCATPRSASNLLGDTLLKNGMGHAREYRNRKHLAKAKWDKEKPLEIYCKKLLNLGKTPNGVSGIKMMWYQMEDFVHEAKKIPKYKNVSVWTILNYFPPLKYIRITRRNKIRQAVSFAKALQTDMWRFKKGQVPKSDIKLKFNPQQIGDSLRELMRSEKYWDKFFKKNNIKPLVIVYEDFVDNYEATIRRVLDYLNLPIPKKIKKSKLVKQADAQSEEWIKRYSRIKAKDRLIIYLRNGGELLRTLYKLSAKLKQKSETYAKIVRFIKG